MNVLASLTVLGLLIFFHEGGHFLAAKCQGILVNGFSIGFGPALFKKELKGVTYSIRALPLGGFVSFPDEEKNSGIPEDDPNLLRNRPIIQRAFVISAGVLTNLLLAWLILIGQATFVGLQEQPNPGIIVMSVQPGEAAEAAGLLPGDKIMSIDGLTLGRGQEAVQSLVKRIQTSSGTPMQLERIRKDEKKLLLVTPSEYSGSGRIGVQLQPNLSNNIHPAEGIGEVVNQANTQFISLLTRTIKGYQGLITDFGATAQQVSGPVKIVEIGAHFSQEGLAGLSLFAALISINLAVLNSLPLPLLDGGQLLMILIEGIIRKPIPERIQAAFIQSGFLLLVGVSLILIIRDTSQLSMVQKLISHQ